MPTDLSRRKQDRNGRDDAPSVRVLVVDDDENFRFWLAALMRRLGFAVETAVDGEDGLAKLLARPFDLLISDLEMPKMNGMELIRAIRATPTLVGQYAVMLTSHDDVKLKVEALTIGYDDFLTKSCTEVEVSAKVVAAKRMLSRQQLLSVAVREWQTLASRDELTGVAARRTFFEDADRCLAEHRAIGVAILDLNEFKAVNDTFGHLTGDRILTDIGALFRGRTRGGDLIARYGGDEFVLLVPDLPLDDVAGAAERLTQEIALLQWTLGEVLIQVTATFGVAHSSLLPRATVEQLLEAADRDLYAKKWLRKNPAAAPELYEYPGAQRPAAVVTLPMDVPGSVVAKRPAVED
ncbi:MAG TPA: diguanylate cyclase [Thermoanaerobaculia bacterium]|nr:diguanylate cyclase [Thermoanaerobaculia bacterium]